jgi:hypothetical protein
MTPRIALACAATSALVTACGVAGDDPRPPSASALERAQATAAAQPAPASMPQPGAQAQAAQPPAAAPRSPMLAAEQTGLASAHAQRQDGVLRVDNHLRPEYS